MTSPSTRRGSLESGLDLLEALVEHPRGLGVTEVAAHVGIDKGNAHRLLRTLQARGYVSQDGARRFTATAQIIGLAGTLLRRLDLRTVAEPICLELLETTGESVHASQVTRNGVVYVLQRRPSFRVSIETEIGARAPLHCTATGKAVLAYMPEAEVRDLLGDDEFEAHTMRTRTTIDALLRDLEDVRKLGYSIDDEELNIGVRCLGAPVFGIESNVIGCIGVSGPVQRVGLERIDELAGLVTDAARRVTEGLGGAVPSTVPTVQLPSTPPGEQERDTDTVG